MIYLNLGCKRKKHRFVLRFMSNGPYLRHILIASIQLGIHLHIHQSCCHISRTHCNLRCNFLDNSVHTNRLDNLLTIRIKTATLIAIAGKKEKKNPKVINSRCIRCLERDYSPFVKYIITSV